MAIVNDLNIDNSIDFDIEILIVVFRRQLHISLMQTLLNETTSNTYSDEFRYILGVLQKIQKKPLNDIKFGLDCIIVYVMHTMQENKFLA